MATILDEPPAPVRVDLQALEESLTARLPSKNEDNLLIATWNLRRFGGLTREWMPTGTSYSPKRDLRALRSIIGVVSRFDVIAIQEVTGDLRALRDMMRFLGDRWAFVMTDVTRGAAGNSERLAFLFDMERVKMSGLACEVVVPPEWIDGSDPDAAMNRQFARTPYAVSFQAGLETFILLTAHIDYGSKSSDRIPELKAVAGWMRDWAEDTGGFGQSLLVLGDFNIDRKDDELWRAFTSTNLYVPDDLQAVPRSIFIEPGADPRLDKYYDQIAWFNSRTGKAKTDLIYRKGGFFDFVPFCYSETGITKASLSHRVSDHYPLWAEFERRR